MNNTKIKQALIGGIAAAAVMTMIMVIAPRMGMPVWTGWAMHLMIGIVWAMVYVFLVRDKLSISYALRGMLFAVLPWVLMQLMVMPMMGTGIFSSNAPDALKIVMGTLMGHLVYGLVLGLTTKPTQN